MLGGLKAVREGSSMHTLTNSYTQSKSDAVQWFQFSKCYSQVQVIFPIFLLTFPCCWFLTIPFVPHGRRLTSKTRPGSLFWNKPCGNWLVDSDCVMTALYQWMRRPQRAWVNRDKRVLRWYRPWCACVCICFCDKQQKTFKTTTRKKNINSN